ncbi:hypothetical protein HK097_011154 [Rhizophlyctis rosea]|uniref:Uncharacterized protein n=1 Tax=Rhizophlyctis rosea TaxID=64517 RepID=A0AAD5S6R6_9FUNG|nr:hypothetical protein HK097_011154 [Rhizophlyctis rosea]
MNLTYPGVGGNIAYFRVFAYEDCAKVRNGEEKVIGLWKIKEGSLEDRLLGVAEDAWRLVVSWTPKDGNAPTAGGILFRWSDADSDPEHTSAPINPFEKVGLGDYTLPPVTRTGLQLPFPKPRNPMTPQSWSHDLPLKLSFKSAENAVTDNGMDRFIVALNLTYPDGAKIDMRKSMVSAHYHLRDHNDSAYPINLVADRTGSPVDDFQWRSISSNLLKCSYPPGSLRQPKSLTVSMEWDNIIDNALLNAQSKDWPDFGGVTSRAGPLLIDIVITDPATGHTSGICIERCTTPSLSHSFVAASQRSKDFIGDLTVDVGNIWRRDRVVMERGTGRSVITVRAEAPFDTTHTFDVYQLRQAVSQALQTNTTEFLLARNESPDLYKSTVTALIDFSRKVVYALQIDLTSKDGQSRGFFRVPEYGDTVGDACSEVEEIAFGNIEDDGGGLEVIRVTEAMGVSGLERGYVGEVGERYVDQAETEFHLRIDDEGDEDVVAEEESDGDDFLDGYGDSEVEGEPERRVIEEVKGTNEAAPVAEEAVSTRVRRAPVPALSMPAPKAEAAPAAPRASIDLDALVMTLTGKLRLVLKKTLGSDMRKVVKEELALTKAPSPDLVPVLTGSTVRTIIREEVRTIVKEELAKQAAFDPDLVRSLVRTEVRATVRDETDNFLDRLNNAKGSSTASLPRKPSVSAAITVAPSSSVTSRWTPSPTPARPSVSETPKTSAPDSTQPAIPVRSWAPPPTSQGSPMSPSPTTSAAPAGWPVAQSGMLTPPP